MKTPNFHRFLLAGAALAGLAATPNLLADVTLVIDGGNRSEERRVGKECS